jgi:TatD DNase family protein
VIDSHTHVTSCRDDPDSVLDRARAAGVTRVVTIGSSREEMAAATALADRHADVHTTAGLHPHGAAAWDEDLAAEIERHAAHPRVVAVGETGLDFFRDRAPRERQLEAFRGQLEIARRAGLPVVVHCREAEDEVVPLLVAEGPETVVLHCFSMPDRIEEVTARGWYCSFAGNVTYPSAVALQEAARRCPAELLLLETDAPYLTPVPFRGRPNEPAYVIETLRFVAGIRGVEVDELAARTSANTVRAFSLPDGPVRPAGADPRLDDV